MRREIGDFIVASEILINMQNKNSNDKYHLVLTYAYKNYCHLKASL